MTTAAPSLAPPRSWRWHFPLRLRGGLNSREHWRVRRDRVANERQVTRLTSIASLGLKWWLRVQFPVAVVITRYGPRELDTDNLPGSAKGVRDEIATLLGITDGPRDARATWEVKQRKGPYGVEVEIRCVEAVR